LIGRCALVDPALVSAKYNRTMPFVSVTRLRVRALRYLPTFSFNALRAARQAKTAPGNLAVSLLADANLAFWTRTLWNDQDAMRAFMLSGAHRQMMPCLLNWCDEAAVAHWTQDSIETPSWEEVHGRMRTQGRRSNVNHPSEAQQRFEIPVPRTTTGLKLK
jgi:heme-degrading monooxygenase HmoA